MLIDDFLPRYSTSERHATLVRAPVGLTYEAIRSADLAEALPVRILLALRALPAALRRGRSGVGKLPLCGRAPITLRDFERSGFAILAEDPPRELLIGLVGAFWTLGGGICATDAEHFRSEPRPGTARTAWNFVVEERHGGVVTLSTETRVQPSDPHSARRFHLYWRFVRPWSGRDPSLHATCDPRGS
jgi:hypothetical protein